LGRKLKLIAVSALSAALTVAGLSMAAGGSSGGTATGLKERNADRPPGTNSGVGPPPGMLFDRDVADLIRQVLDKVEKQAPEIAGPVIQKAQDAGSISSAQADRLRAAAQAIADGKRPDPGARELLRDPDVRKVVQDAFQAAAKQASTEAEPLIQKALGDGKITQAQANEIRDRLKNPPPFGPGFRHGPGMGRHFGPIDRDVAAVLGDIHHALESQQPKNANQALAIADPIIQKALDAKRITSAQAQSIRNKLKSPGTLHGPPPFGNRGPGVPPDGPGSRPWEGPGGSRQPPRGNAPGVSPGGATPGAPPAEARPTI
jgi:hypothetical protein